MRLTCPNCGAQYEVPDDVIPAAGRDVQCSNCGNTWFEGPDGPVAIPERSETLDRESSDRPRRPTRTVSAPPPEIEDQGDDEDDEDGLAAAPASGAGRKSLDPDIANILRQEAEIERAARQKRDPEALQSQPDLGLDAALPDPEVQRAEESRRRMARLKGEPAPRPGEAATNARSERLPDIEEINSTLRSTRERATSDAANTMPEPQRASGFRLGFGLTLLVLAIGMLTYTFSREIGEQVPQLAPYLDRFVTEVEALRLWVDQQIQSLIQRFAGAS